MTYEELLSRHTALVAAARDAREAIRLLTGTDQARTVQLLDSVLSGEPPTVDWRAKFQGLRSAVREEFGEMTQDAVRRLSLLLTEPPAGESKDGSK